VNFLSKNENKDKLPVKELSIGHRDNASIAKSGDFICPECNKTFSTKERAEQHLHAEHSQHLVIEHTENHSKDFDQRHHK
jgi:hypothetical protein